MVRGVLSRGKWVSVIVILSMVLLSACGGNKDVSTPSATPSVTTSATPDKATPSPTSTKPQEHVKLKILSFASWFKPGIEAVAKDASEKLGIDLEFDKAPESAAGSDILKTRFATQDLPDILLYYNGEGNLTPLGDPEKLFASQEDQPWIQNFDKSAWMGQVDYKGKFISAPYAGIFVAPVLYNKKVFDSLGLKIPTNYTEFLALCDALKKAGKVPMYMSGKDAWTLQLFGVESAALPGYFDFVSKLNVNKAKFVEWDALKLGLTSMLDLNKKGYYNKDLLSATYTDAQKALATGQAGMYLMGTWIMEDFRKAYPDQLNDISAFVLPFQGDGKDLLAAYPPNAMYVIKGGKNQEAAQKFVNFFESVEEQNVYFSNEGGLPTIKGVTKTNLTPAELEAKKFVDEGKVGGVLGVGYIHDGSTNFPTYSQDILAGGKTVDQVLQAMDKDYMKSAQSKNDPNFK